MSKTSSSKAMDAGFLTRIVASAIDRYPANRMPGDEAVKAMAASVREHGVLQPVTVRPSKEFQGRFQLIFGETRWAGCKRVQKDFEVPAFVLDVDDKEASRLHAVENFQREDLDLIEEGRAMRNMVDAGWSVAEVAASVGRSQEVVYLRLRLLKLPEPALEAMRDGNLDVMVADKLLRVPEEQVEHAMEDILRPAASDKPLPRQQALALLDREYLAPAKEAEEWEKRKRAALREFPKAKWLDAAEAAKVRKWNSGYERAEDRPDGSVLSAAAMEDEIRIPTWGELAEKHGADTYIGMGENGDPEVYVQPAALMDAERAACDGNPAACIFDHPQARKAEAETRERMRMQAEADRAAMMREREVAYRALTNMKKPLGKAVALKVAVGILDRLVEQGFGDNLKDVFSGNGEDEAILAAELMMKGADNAMEALGRLMTAVELTTIHGEYEFGELALETGLATGLKMPKTARKHAEAKQKITAMGSQAD
jgi:ParB/RepB/Spo0J family partition protein